MLQSNFFDNQETLVNDMADYKLPYTLVSKTDDLIMAVRYQNLVKQSYGAIVRLGAGFYG